MNESRAVEEPFQEKNPKPISFTPLYQGLEGEIKWENDVIKLALLEYLFENFTHKHIQIGADKQNLINVIHMVRKMKLSKDFTIEKQDLLQEN